LGNNELFFAFIFDKIFISIVNIGHGMFSLWGVILVKAVMLGVQTKARELKKCGAVCHIRQTKYGKNEMIMPKGNFGEKL
jgi:hypothetical protein